MQVPMTGKRWVYHFKIIDQEPGLNLTEFKKRGICDPSPVQGIFFKSRQSKGGPLQAVTKSKLCRDDKGPSLIAMTKK